MKETTVDSVEETIEAIAELIGPVSRRRANRFYDRLRAKVARAVEDRGTPGNVAELLLFVPDVFILLWRLAMDARVEIKNKLLLGTTVTYFIFPLDFIPEALLGPVGYMDDLVLAAFVLNRMVNSIDKKVLREHWSGNRDLLEVIKRILQLSDQVVSTDLVKKIKRIANLKST